MSYTPTEWKTGDVVTSEKLNNIENGITKADPFIVTFTHKSDMSSTTGLFLESDKRVTQIIEAMKAGKNVYAIVNEVNTNEAFLGMTIPLAYASMIEGAGSAVFNSVSVGSTGKLSNILITMFSTPEEPNDIGQLINQNYQLTPMSAP